MLNFEITPTSVLSGESFAALLFAALFFIAVPLFLAVLEYRVTQKNKKHGFYLLIGVFSSAILFGIFSFWIGILPAVIYWIVSHSPKKAKR